MTKARHIGALGLALGLATCSPKPSRPPGEPAGPTPRAVATAAVERTGGGDATVPGTVRARQRSALAARIPASVVALPYREGDAVPAGAVAVRLDDTAVRAA